MPGLKIAITLVVSYERTLETVLMTQIYPSLASMDLDDGQAQLRQCFRQSLLKILLSCCSIRKR